ncbi:MAG: HAD family phosphatase [Caulobacteraceae bacterium]|nr:HAD family phosphatase [Caulobacteraceae bacterium]
MELYRTPWTLSRLPVAVVFDMDGLILDTERLWMAAMIETMADHQREMSVDFYRAMLGTPWLGIRERLIEHYGPTLAVDDIRPVWTARFVELCKAQLALKTGVRELLDLLDDLGIPAAVATSSPRDLVLEHFAHLGLASRFQHVLAQGDYPKGKPDPAPYLSAAARLGVRPEDCLALEDSHNGVRSASSAGMMTIMVPDLVGPTEEIAALCLGVSLDLHEVGEAIAEAARASNRDREITPSPGPSRTPDPYAEGR